LVIEKTKASIPRAVPISQFQNFPITQCPHHL
jgi:hypothetical protein